jgi:hypothetical protein
VKGATILCGAFFLLLVTGVSAVTGRLLEFDRFTLGQFEHRL